MLNSVDCKWQLNQNLGGTSYNGLYGEAPPERGFRKLRYIKGLGNRSFRYLKGPLIIIFRIDAPYGCISLFIIIKH